MTGGPGGLGPLVALGAEAVLVLPGDAVLVGDPLGRVAHRPVLEGAGQAVVGHVVLHGRGAVLHTASNVGEVGGEIHVLHAAGDRDLDVAGLDRPGRLHDRFESRTADLVDGDGGHGVGDAGLEGRLSGGVLADARLEHAAHEDFFDRPASRPASVMAAWMERRPVRGRVLGRSRRGTSDGGAAGGEDDGSGGVAHARRFVPESGLAGLASEAGGSEARMENIGPYSSRMGL